MFSKVTIFCFNLKLWSPVYYFPEYPGTFVCKKILCLTSSTTLHHFIFRGQRKNWIFTITYSVVLRRTMNRWRSQRSGQKDEVKSGRQGKQIEPSGRTFFAVGPNGANNDGEEEEDEEEDPRDANEQPTLISGGGRGGSGRKARQADKICRPKDCGQVLIFTVSPSRVAVYASCKAPLLHFQRPFRMDNIDKRTRKEWRTARNFAESRTRGSQTCAGSREKPVRK